MQLKRATLFVGVVVTMLFGGSVSAFADTWSSVECTQSSTAGCQLGAGTSGNSNKPVLHKTVPLPQAGNGVARSVPSGASVEECVMIPSDYNGPPPEGSNGDGGWYDERCFIPGTYPNMAAWTPFWIPNDHKPALPSPAELAQRAYSSLRLPTLTIKANPAGEQIVNVPTWLWMDRASWQNVSATAGVPGVSVTAVARPMSVSWSMGDGHTITCSGPGTPYVEGDPSRNSPDCGYTYKISSAGQRDHAFAVTATVHWNVTWSGGGQGGTFPDLTTTSSTQLRVAEIQALTTG